ncbi:phospholipase D-like domain-containing protein [uncultured Psychrobacter sp.]|uniref:phospholipase D-like domain-containing protein n=1 Tax=uncultured Psychrobacter sp. TaxID=259303 RepID=UPI003458BCE8
MILKKLVSAIALTGSAIVIARSVFALPKIEERIDSTALPKTMSGPLAEALIKLEVQHKGLTGVAPLQNSADAFAARILLADAAVSSLDIQYYMWHADLTGTLLLDALVRAANRGVQVWLLLDDNGTTGLDGDIAALVAHPNIEVRLYNPFNLRTFKTLSYAFDFFRLNRRMHNKSFTVDGRATILGGRNVGDEYFGTGSVQRRCLLILMYSQLGQSSPRS